LAAAVDAVSICAPQRAMRTLIDEGSALREVIDFARERMPSWSGDARAGHFIDEFLTLSDRADRAPAARGSGRRADPDFSQRETEVARLLTAGQSNRDMAQALGMAPDTVKWHLKNIFGKLGVANRT